MTLNEEFFAQFAEVFKMDPGVAVVLLTQEGEILFHNRTAAAMFLGDPNSGNYVGKKILDIYDPDWARERLEWIGKALREKRPVASDHILRGRRIGTMIYPLEGEGEPTRVMTVTRYLTSDAEMPAEADVARAETKLIDLGPFDKLTPRELETLVLLGAGKSVPEVAKELHRSPKTIERHKTSIGKKLSASTAAELAALVTKVGLDVDHLKLQRVRALREEKLEKND
jgi:DNA-binding CsgD family transcriptional regulator